MKPPRKPITFGGLELPHRIFYAPLAGCSDFPFRRISAKLGSPALMFCEMVKMDALVRNDPGTFRILDFDTSMHPIGGQICGSKLHLAGKSAKIIEELGFDSVDLNCGCPVDKVTKDGSGSGLLKNPRLIGDIVAEMSAAVKIPVTLKIRAGWNEDTIYAAEITRLAEEAGAKAICVHARTREQGYQGPAKWDWITACKEAAKTIHVIGNGDLFAPEDIIRMFTETNCDAVLVARGTLGNPWIAQDALKLAEGLEVTPRSVQECLEGLAHHFEEVITYHPARKAIVEMRKVGCWYLKKSAGTRTFREKMSRVSSVEEIRELIATFPGDSLLA